MPVTIIAIGGQQAEQQLGRIAQGMPGAIFNGVSRGTTLIRNMLFDGMSAKPIAGGFFGVMSPPAPMIAVRTGHTRSRLSQRVTRSGNVWIGSVSHPEEHVRDMEEGGTFSGKSPGGFHRIPTAWALTGAGVDRNMGRSMRGVQGYAVFKSKRGNLFIWRVDVKPIEPWYLLKEQVTRDPKRLFHSVGVRAQPVCAMLFAGEISLHITRTR
jgi:hypothetical protein